MEYIKWTEKFSVNVANFDDQHKKLIDEINKFYNSLGTKPGKEVISDMVYQLKKYSLFHFQSEENVMKKYSFPGFLVHKKEHDAFIAKIEDLEKKLNDGKMVLTIEVTNFMKEWLSNHILKTDKEYTKFLNDCGIK